jgi:ADP-ribosylglycohydrolase
MSSQARVLTAEASTRAARCRVALEGLSVADAFGDRYFGPGVEVMPRIAARTLAPAPWGWTDDTHMAATIAEQLAERGAIDQDVLAARFAERMDPHRKYGVGAFNLLTAIREGAPWRRAAVSLFDGKGSFGNGAAMRSAPLGAYFADDLARVVREATLASEVTHAHPEGIAGGIAVAVAAAHACRGALDATLLDAVLEHTPRGYTHETLTEARALRGDVGLVAAAQALGNGSGVTAPDTVPLCLWICAHHARSYEDALWLTVSALGDRDTTCAIVGAIVACARGLEDVPQAWREAREPLPDIAWP